MEGESRTASSRLSMTRLTFGISASSSTANMAMKLNALENVDTHPPAIQVVLD